jgi:hypothetical protein
MEAEPQQRPEQDRSPAEAIGKRAQQRGTEKLHDPVGDDQHAIPIRLQFAVGRVQADQHRDDRKRDADAQHVDEDDDEDKRHPGLPAGRLSSLDQSPSFSPPAR